MRTSRRATPRRFVVTIVLGLCMLALAGACGGGQSTSTPTTAATATTSHETSTPISQSETPTASPVGSPTGTATSPAPTGTEKPSPDTGNVSPLNIDGEPVVQVEVPAPGIDVTYAITKGGLYRRAPEQDWVRVSEEVTDGAHILVDPTRPDILYRGDHPGCAVGGEPVPFRRSPDGGKTWQTLPGGENIRPLATDPVNGGRLYGENCSKLAISTDGGETWTTSQPVPGFDIASLALVGTQLYGIYTSEGGTSRLLAIDVSDPANPVTGNTLLQFWGGGVIYASLDRIVIGEPHGAHVSTDGGKTWTFSRKGLEDVTVSVDALSQPIPQQETSKGFGIFAIATDPKRPERLYVGTIRGLYLSTNNGKSWQQVPDVDAERVGGLAFSMPRAALYITTDDGALVLSNP